MTSVTKVLYDVSQAIKELAKLDKKVEDSGKKTTESFDKADKGASQYEAALGKLAPKLTQTAGASKTLLGTLGGAGLVFGAAAAGVASVAANVLDLKTLLRDTTSNFQSFIDVLDKVREARESVSAFGDVAAQRDIEAARRAVKLDQADQAERQNEVERAKDIARQRLDIVRDRIRQEEALVKEGLRREQDLRQRLESRQAGTVGAQFAGFDADRQAAKLNEEARLAAGRGELDLAEKLEQKAQQISAEAENQAFAAADRARTAEIISAAIDRELQAQKQANDQAGGQLEQLKEVEKALENDIKLQDQKLKTILQQNRELTRQAKLIKDAALAQRNLEAADTAARGVETAAVQLNQFIRGGFESGAEAAENKLQNIFGSITGGAIDQAAVDAFSSMFIQQIEPILQLTSRVQRGEDVTALDFQEIQSLIPSAQELAGVLQQAISEDRVGKGQIENTEQLLAVMERILQLNEEVTQFRRRRGDDAVIREGSRDFTRDELNALREAVLENTRALQEPSRGAAARAGTTDQAAATSRGAQVERVSSTQTVNVNATVKGGLIDPETTRIITRLIREELRKGTTENVA